MADDALRPATDLRLPLELRSALARPFGPIVQTEGLTEAIGGRPFVAVGDVVAMTAHGLGLRPRAFVCDYKTQRGADDPAYVEVLGAWGDRVRQVANPPGMLTLQAWDAATDALGQEEGVLTRIEVDGEEDLLGLPFFAVAPPGTVVLYGMPGEGVVVGVCDGPTQAKARAIVAQMASA